MGARQAKSVIKNAEAKNGKNKIKKMKPFRKAMDLMGASYAHNCDTGMLVKAGPNAGKPSAIHAPICIKLKKGMTILARVNPKHFSLYASEIPQRIYTYATIQQFLEEFTATTNPIAIAKKAPSKQVTASEKTIKASLKKSPPKKKEAKPKNAVSIAKVPVISKKAKAAFTDYDNTIDIEDMFDEEDLMDIEAFYDAIEAEYEVKLDDMGYYAVNGDDVYLESEVVGVDGNHNYVDGFSMAAVWPMVVMGLLVFCVCCILFAGVGGLSVYWMGNKEGDEVRDDHKRNKKSILSMMGNKQ